MILDVHHPSKPTATSLTLGGARDGPMLPDTVWAKHQGQTWSNLGPFWAPPRVKVVLVLR